MEFIIGDEYYADEVNTSYDQDQPIGDEPQALYTEPSNSEPIDARTGDDFMDIKKGEEKLNKDGSGVARATRGVSPNRAKHKVLRFEYVSSSDCEICKEFDGKTFAIDSPNRPVIPRLEKGGGGRPYTHPNCKCRWKNVFNESMTKDELYNSECQDCGAPKSDHPNNLDYPHEWLPEYPTDYEGDMSPANEDAYDRVFDNMTDEQRVMYEQIPHESEEPWDGMNKTEYLEILSANEGGRGSGKKGHSKWMLGAEVGDECPNCMMITEVEDDKCMVCGK